MNEERQIKWVPIDSIYPYEGNPRINQEAITPVAYSIKEFGFRSPVLVDANNIIIAGHTRLKAAQQLGLSEVPVIAITDLMPEQVDALRLADNQTASLSKWDQKKLELELAKLNGLIDMSLLGFDLQVEAAAVDDDYDFDLPKTPQSKTGDLYRLGEHRLLCADATDKEAVARLVDGEAIDLLLTDPPYNVDYEGKAGKIANDKMAPDEFVAMLSAAFACATGVMRAGAPFYIWLSSRTLFEFLQATRSAHLAVRQQLIWVKNQIVLGRQDYQWKHEPCLYGFGDEKAAALYDEGFEAAAYGWKGGAAHEWHGGRRKTTILEFDKPVRSEEHPTMKPLPLMGPRVSNSSKRGAAVLDLFGGSGSTLMACEQLRRRCFMTELDPSYVDVIIKRWERFTGREAQRLEA